MIHGEPYKKRNTGREIYWKTYKKRHKEKPGEI